MATFRGLGRRILVSNRAGGVGGAIANEGDGQLPLMDVSITEKTALSGAGVANIDAQTAMTATHRERKEASEDGGRSWSRAGPSTSPTGSFGTTDRVHERGRDLQLSGHGEPRRHDGPGQRVRPELRRNRQLVLGAVTILNGSRTNGNTAIFSGGGVANMDGIDTLDSDVQIRSHAATAGGIRTGERHAEPRWHRSVSTSRTTRRTISPTRAARQSVTRRRRAAPRARARRVAGATPLRSR
jgi:hypothetical protein